jgi:hypothetical protein
VPVCRGFRLATSTVSQVSDAVTITSVRRAAAVCNVSPPVVRRWLYLGLIASPPWKVGQLHEVRDLTDPEGRRRGNRAPHGTITRWNAGCSCAECRLFQSDDARARGRPKAQVRLPADVRQQLLDAICAGQPFRAALRDLELTPNQVWGLAMTNDQWSSQLDAALTATRREDLRHGTTAAYVRGCVCKDCREHQRIRMAKSR